MTAMEAEKVGHTLLTLQLRHVNIQVHAVDSFDLEGDMLGEDFSHGSW